MVDAAAAANHGLLIPSDIPGKTEGRIEVVLVAFRRTQVAAEQRGQVGRTIQIVVEQVIFVAVSHAVAEGEARRDAPLIGDVQAVAVIAPKACGWRYVCGWPGSPTAVKMSKIGSLNRSARLGRPAAGLFNVAGSALNNGGASAARCNGSQRTIIPGSK